ncbi:Flagellar biosynthesis protein FlhF [compost metagenome]
MARSAVGATGRSIDSSIELAPGSRFASLLKRPSADDVQSLPQPQIEAQRYATLPVDEPPVVPVFRPAASAPVNVVPPKLPEAVNERPVERARFFIDPPPHEDEAPAPAPAAMPQAVFAAAPAAGPVVAEAIAAPAAADVAPTLITQVISNAGNERELNQLRQEVVGMRQMIEREMNRFTDERLRGSAVRGNALDLMEEYGFDPGLSRDVVMQIPADTDPPRARGLMLGLISRKLPVAPIDPIETGGVIALVGPTGAGKTTTIAKLASRFADAHAARDVALVTTDTQRIGAREQLYGFGRQLGIAVHEANSSTNLNQLLERLTDYKLVLIDTAGLGQRDRALTAQLQWLRAAGQIRTLLVLPANTSFQDMDEVVRRFSAANPQGLVLTKLDETGRFGSALSVAVDHRLPITWVTDGQDVPEDLHRASAANLVLRLEDLRRAADMPCNPELNNAVA